MKLKFRFLFYFSIVVNSLQAGITLPSLIGDHMVLQRESMVKFWGWGEPNEKITIEVGWSKEIFSATTNSDAKWEIVIPTTVAGGPYSIKLKGYNEVIINDVLLGDVWLCSGQSNMDMNVGWGILDGEKHAAEATDSGIRMFNVSKRSSEFPQDNVQGNWAVNSPEVMKYSSSVSYFFAKKLRENRPDIPIGLVNSAWGGTAAEVWMPESSVLSDETLKMEADKIKPNEYCPNLPGRTYNAMIYPLLNYHFFGTIWYQGESNVGSTHYDKTFSTLISTWRKEFKTDFPFYFVQIAPYNDGFEHDGGVQIRDAQRKVVQMIPKTGMVVISDISPTDDIHPKDKKSVGDRLGNLILKEVYHINNDWIGFPLVEKAVLKNSQIELNFKNNKGLHFTSPTSTQFQIAGADGIYHEVSAEIKDEKVFLDSKKIKSPKYVRFAWGNATQSELFNEANLPASSFQIQIKE